MDKNTLGVLLIAGTLIVSGCGQRNDEVAATTDQSTTDSGTDVDTGTTVPDIGAAITDQLNVRVLSNVNSINTGGTDVANITALVTDANNNALAATAGYLPVHRWCVAEYIPGDG